MLGLSALDFQCAWICRPSRIHISKTSVHILKYRYEPLHIPACSKDVRMVSIAYGMVQSELQCRLHFRCEPDMHFADYLRIPTRTQEPSLRLRPQVDEGNLEIYLAIANLGNHRQYEPICRQDLLSFHRSWTGRRNPAWNLWCLREDCNDYGDDYPGFPLRIRAVCLRRKPRRSQEEQGNAGKGDEIFCHLHTSSAATTGKDLPQFRL